MQQSPSPLINTALRLLVRPNDWWQAKIPLSILLMLLLARDASFTTFLPPLLGLLFVVCCVGNYGFAINDLFDEEEDRLAGKPNAATERGAGFVWAVAVASAVLAMSVAGLFAGPWGALLTAGTLMLPLIYSVPPIRTKERGWLGVLADAVAAHMFPAFLALLILERQGLHEASPALIAIIAIWSFLTGVRNILQHQLYSMESDAQAGLSTVVHDRGHARLQAVVLYGVLPPELLAFGALVVFSDPSAFLLICIAVYVAIEALKTFQNVIVIDVFTERSTGFIPFADDGIYKVWGPVALTIEASFADTRYLLLIPAMVGAFWPRYLREFRQIRHTSLRLWNVGRRVRKRWTNLARKHLRRGFNQTRGRLRRWRNRLRAELRKRRAR